MEETRFISAVILLSADPAKLAAFYHDAVGVPLEVDQHAPGVTPPHFECQLGDVHFAIHPHETIDGDNERQLSRIKIAFAVSDLTKVLGRLNTYGVLPLYPPVDRGFAFMTAVLDPEGNRIELTQLSRHWLDYLNSRGAEQRNLVVSLRQP